MADIQVHYLHAQDSVPPADETIALYVEGELKCIGPQADVLEKAIRLLGIKQVFDPDFMQGQETYQGAARTLEQIKSYKAEKNRDEANELREQAAELLRKANELEGHDEEE